MASLSKKYLVEDSTRSDRPVKEEFGKRNALMYSTRVDLLPLLLVSENKMESLPVFYLLNARA